MSNLYKVFNPSGIIDEQAAENLREEIRSATAAGYRHILIDMHGVTFMNSSAVGILVTILKELRNQAGELYLCALSDQVQVMLELSRMNLIFRCFASIREFETKIVGSLS
jgi:anti-anti-sigma factor